MTDKTEPNKPPRADPIQPDKPGSGTSRESPPEGNDAERAVQRQKKQSDTALDNVREGYD